MKTLVTGANGLLGSNVVRELLNRNHEVRALLRKGSDTRTIAGLGIEIIYGDLSDQESLDQACCGVDFVIHAGGKTGGAQTRYADFADTNVRGTMNVVKAARIAGVKRMVHVSSCCVFGGGSLEEPGTELSEFTGFKYNSGYIYSKYMAQQLVLSEYEKTGFPVVIVNPTIMLGPYDARPTSGEAILQVLQRQCPLCPTGGKNFIDVRDAAYATCNALTMGRPGECYLLASENLTMADFFDKVESIYGREPFHITIPAPVLKGAGMVGNALRALTHRDIPLNLATACQLSTVSFFSGEKAVRDLNLRQRPVDAAIRDAIEWFIANGYLAPRSEPAFSEPVLVAA